MSFEKQFPSLKGKIEDGNLCGLDGVYCKEIKEHCLDKQKVKEAIEKTLKNCYDDEEWQNKRHLFSELEEELGLKGNVERSVIPPALFQEIFRMIK